MGIDMGRFKRQQSEEWLDWLQDDPAPVSVRQEARKRAVRSAQSAPTPAKPQSPESKTIAINVTLPKFQFDPLLQRVRSVAATKKFKIGAGIASSIVVGLVAVPLITQLIPDKQANPGANVLSDTTSGKPSFEYVVPKGDESELAAAVRYDSEKQVVNYADSIGGVNITISQQALPDSFKADSAAKVKEIAEGFGAKEVIATANPTAYIGTSAKGPQTVIFAKNNSLVFIYSVDEIDTVDWAEYITALK